jgi:choice-of-anchor B domain-containing protein
MRLCLSSVLVVPLWIAACGGSGDDSTPVPVPPPDPTPPSTAPSVGPSACASGRAGDFPCSGIALQKRLALGDMGGGSGNDVWGWVDPETGNEYALMGLSTGTAFIDVTDPQSPAFLGRLPTETSPSTWRDIKVYADHAYVVADGAGNHGMQVFDLRRLRGVTVPQAFGIDARYVDFGSAHNIAINEDSGFAYAVGTDTCPGLHIIDVSTPNSPSFSHCYDVVYTHDTQRVDYHGPDIDHAGAEICVSANEDHVEIVDVSFKPSPLRLARVEYVGSAYVHQGWLTEDHRYFLLGDEADEALNGHGTRTYVFDLTDLDNPFLTGFHEAETASIDHNLYIVGDRVYQANYSAGLRVLELLDASGPDMIELAYFDTLPDSDELGFTGAWSVYPYLPSGNILVSDTALGLFVLAMQ